MVAAIVDTGPLVAFLDRREQHHRWVVERIAEIEALLLVCEPVLAETMYLLASLSKAQDAVFALLGTALCRSPSGSRNTPLIFTPCTANTAIDPCRSPTLYRAHGRAQRASPHLHARFRLHDLPKAHQRAVGADSPGGFLASQLDRTPKRGSRSSAENRHRTTTTN
ncbi:MAG: PIN domain-containing protein [Rhodospirillales bacterium]|nr:PIN domain-containing protein [Rhodospirillales bacterium]